MKISDAGLSMVEDFEGWEHKTEDGRYCAYQDVFNGKKDVPTIGPGVTEGVLMGMIWTRDECEAAFRREMVKHEKAVTQLVTVEIGQNAFDALTSFSYNLGTGIGAKKGGLANSSVLKKLNAGDKAGAAKAFILYDIAGGAHNHGLAVRRSAEMALFLKPDKGETHRMPQTVEAAPTPPARGTVATAAAAAGAVSSMAADPSALTAKLSAYKELTTIVTSFGPWMAACALAIGAAFWVYRGN